MLKHIRRLLFVIIAATAITALSCSAALADGPVILLIADRLVLSDLTENAPPNITRLVNESAIGLISANPGSKKTVESTYVSMGAAAGMLGSASAYEGYSASETLEGSLASEVYARRMGEDAPPGSVANLELPRLIRLNKRVPGLPGGLGEALRKQGKRVAVFGNSDTLESRQRPAVAVAMDARGLVPEGDVSTRLLRREIASPTGKAVHVPRLLRAVAEASERCDLIVIEFGDTQRLEDARDRVSEAAHSYYLREAISRLDDLVGGLLRICEDSSSDLILVSPLPRLEGPNVDRLSPIVYRPASVSVGSGWNKSLLTSGSTRTDGLVCAIDVAPTILARLSTPLPAHTLGKPMTVKENADRLATLNWLDSLIIFHTHAEMPILGAIAGLGVFAVTALGLLVAFNVRPTAWILTALRTLLLALYASPLAMLIASLYNGRSLVGYAITLIVIDAAILLLAVVLVWLIGNRRTLISSPIPALPAMVSLMTAVALVLDVVTGARLTTYSLASTYQLTGLRFYGVGNEYMGVLIGHGALGLLWIRQQLSVDSFSLPLRVFFIAAAVVMVVIIGFPDLGANVGGEIAALIGLGLCCKAIISGNIRWRDGAYLLVASAILLGAFAVIDLYARPESVSHVGQAAREVDESGLRHLYSTATRKVAFNAGLLNLRHSEMAVLGFLPFMMLWFFGVQRNVVPVFKHKAELSNGFKAILVGAAAAFVFNDSGVVAASIILSVPMAALLYLLAGEAGRDT